MASVEKGMSRRQVLKAGVITAAVAAAGHTGDHSPRPRLRAPMAFV